MTEHLEPLQALNEQVGTSQRSGQEETPVDAVEL